MEAAAAASDWERYGVLDLVFHGDLVAAAGSRRLAEEFRRALRPLQLRLLAVDLADVTTGSRHHVAEHGAILDAIASGDPGRALDLIDRHLADVEAVLFEAGASS
jgi:DNA-binding GntR family transcriptional regulator